MDGAFLKIDQYLIGSILEFLSDETAGYKKDGTPEYIRFYRSSSPRRERVYEWIYTEPIHFVTFIDGKKVDSIVLDDRTSPLKEKEGGAGPNPETSQDIEWLGP